MQGGSQTLATCCHSWRVAVSSSRFPLSRKSLVNIQLSKALTEFVVDIVRIFRATMSDEEDTKVSITLRTIVTGPEAGCIIGRGGEVVNSIRDESGAKIKIEGSSQQERIITVDGPTDSIFKVGCRH